jgi:hypothetical protein
MLTEDELVNAFEDGSLSAFPHAEHVRLTIVYLMRHGHDETIRKMYDGLSRFATAKGQPEKFHVTMTRAWVELIESALRAYPGIDRPGALVARCPQLLDRDALLRFYSPARLHSADARERWVLPDRTPAIGVDAESK